MSFRVEPAMLGDAPFRPLGGDGRFEVVVPEQANIAADTVGRHATGVRASRVALLFEDAAGALHPTTYAELDARATRIAAGLAARGVRRGDVLAIHSVQRPETVTAHLAIYKLGAIVATVSQLTGPDTMAHVLEDSGARILFTHDAAWDPHRRHRGAATTLEHVVCSGGADGDEIAFETLAATRADGFEPARTGREDPALLVYTSGSTGKPKGILHAHRILHALNATIELFYNLELREDALVFWTAADWAWIGGLNDVVFPALTHGHTLMVSEHRYEAQWALEFMGRHGVTHGLLTPTALKRLAQFEDARDRFGLALRTVFTGGEALPGETHRLLTERLGIVCNEGYGTSEVNQMIGNCQRLRPIRPGSMGWEFPGHRVRLVDEDGRDVADGEPGEIVVGADDPTLFLGYWKQPELTAATRLADGWVRTHDLAVRDADGYYWYRGRNDDLIKSAGFRIGPAEVEEALLAHPAVSDAGVIGVPDADRGTIVKAFVCLAASASGSDALADALRAHVKAHIGPYKQPRVIEFVDALPLTRTGKVSRAELRRLEQARRAVQQER